MSGKELVLDLSDHSLCVSNVSPMPIIYTFKLLIVIQIEVRRKNRKI